MVCPGGAVAGGGGRQSHRLIPRQTFACPAKILDDSVPLDVTLRFKPGAAYYVEERIWHPTETKQHNPDGSLTLRFQATGRIEIERWIRSWGDECEVVGTDEAG